MSGQPYRGPQFLSSMNMDLKRIDDEKRTPEQQQQELEQAMFGNGDQQDQQQRANSRRLKWNLNLASQQLPKNQKIRGATSTGRPKPGVK